MAYGNEAGHGALAGSEVEWAYRRTDIMDLRRDLMTAWAAYCEPSAGGNVISILRTG